MDQVRLASVDYAAGRISEVVEGLRREQRIVEADTPEELLDALVADWYVDRIHRPANPEVPPSSMMADHHVERREFNAAARALLVGQGTLSGPVVEVAGQRSGWRRGGGHGAEPPAATSSSVLSR